MFLTLDDYLAVSDPKSFDVIKQSSEENRERAERYAIEEISSYLRGRYDMKKAFEQTGENRNPQLVMYACDVAIYHLIAWMPKLTGYEIRDIRYKRAMEWLQTVQAGQASPDLPPVTDESGQDTGNPVKWGSWNKNTYDY
jgi:phage gp36-like protein